MGVQTGLDHLQWAHQLGFLVIGKTQEAYRAMSRYEARDYDKLKAAILYPLKIMPDHYRQCFQPQNIRGPVTSYFDAPVEGLVNKWLPLNSFDQEGVLDQILLEQFLWDLEEDTQQWVK